VLEYAGRGLKKKNKKWPVVSMVRQSEVRDDKSVTRGNMGRKGADRGDAQQRGGEDFGNRR